MNQINLIAAISKEITRQGIKEVTARQYNAVINAANDIIKEMERKPVYSSPNMGFSAWVNSDDVGQSSKFMAYVLNSYDAPPLAEPHDSDDFGRCYRMLRAIGHRTEGRYLSEMIGLSRYWDLLIRNWDELSSTYESDIAKKTKNSCGTLLDKLREREKSEK